MHVDVFLELIANLSSMAVIYKHDILQIRSDGESKTLIVSQIILINFIMQFYSWKINNHFAIVQLLLKDLKFGNTLVAATDTDVIISYVRLGFGAGIIAKMAYSHIHDDDLVMRDLAHLFPPSTTRVG